MAELLPSWRPGRARDEALGFLAAAPSIPPERRLACFDNDGTLWCERPRYVQFEFLLQSLRTRLAAEPNLRQTPEFAALIDEDAHAVKELGLPRIALALTGLFEGIEPEVFAAHVRDFMATAVHPTLNRRLRSNVYQPMLELVGELRELGFTITVVTGGGTEFVRAVSEDVYGVPPEHVVGTLIDYDYATDGDGPTLSRAGRLLGDPNEGSAKVVHIQTQLGRRPVLAAGNTSGDREMLEWAKAAEGPTLSLLVVHDDEEREFRYEGTAETVERAEPIEAVGRRDGWTIVSVANDWETVFIPDGG